MTRAVIIDEFGRVRDVSDREFFCRLFGTDEERAERDRQRDERCIAAIRNGDTYGYPPSMVDRCREIMALRDADGSVGDPMLESKKAA